MVPETDLNLRYNNITEGKGLNYLRKIPDKVNHMSPQLNWKGPNHKPI